MNSITSNLFSMANRHMLIRWLREDTLFAFDYDGTLAPLSPWPDQVCLNLRTQQALSELARRACVAVVSGRSQADLLLRLPASLPYIVGNHGNEGLPIRASASAVELKRCCRSWINQLTDLIAESSHWHYLVGMSVEDKGLTLSLHYRHCGDHSAARLSLQAIVNGLVPQPRVIDGVFVLNLLPPLAFTKRDAIMFLMAHSGCTHAIYVGDDATDEQVFERAPPHWLTIKVGDDVNGASPSHARHKLEGQQDVLELLELAVRARQTEQMSNIGAAPVQPSR